MTSPNTRRRSWFVVPTLVALVALIATAVGGCPFTTEGLGGEGGNNDGGTEPCSNDQQCDDKEPCTIDTCPDGTCRHAVLPDGPAPAEQQTADDCKQVLCQNGVSEQVNDDNDFPDDNEDCTIDTCQNGSVFHTAKTDDTNCTTMMGEPGTCQAGKCVFACQKDADCPASTECSSYVCDVATGQCIQTKLPDGTVLMNQTMGDCSTAICLNGLVDATPDDTDIPDDNNDCTTDACVNGMTQFTDNALGTNCASFMGGMGFCDGAGNCSQCSKDSECANFPTDNECQDTQCINFACVTTFTTAGTPLSAPLQTSYDCHELRCDGVSNVPVNAVLDTDLPEDNKECTTNVCTNGTPTNPPLMQGTACGPGMTFMCNAVGDCGCQGNQDCTLPNTCGGGGTAQVCGCTQKTCAQLAPPQTCGIITVFQDTCNLPLNCNTNTKNGGETDVDCGGPVANCPTRCAQGKTCSVGTDCASGFCADGFCCDTACNGLCQACSTAKKGGGQNGVCGNIAVGTDPDNECATDPVSGCQKNGSCNGAGACQLYVAGTVCINASCSAGVANNADTCNGTGTCVDQGTVTCSPYVCGATACLTSCTVDGNCASGFYCSTPNCVPKKPNGTACGGGNQCTSGNCVDGVCCNTACNTTCVACTAAKTGGMDGTCGNVTTNTDPDNECAGGECNGMGACESPNGTACTQGSQCTSGNCVDGFCCNSACGSTCQACSNAKTGAANGTCSNVTVNTDPDNECAGGECNGAGACEVGNGTACTLGSQCISGNCIDGFCCNSTCTALCQACNVAGNLGTCTNVPSNTDPAAECSGAADCNGAGACEVANGTACTLDTQCTSGNCVDGFCCNTTCMGTCQACNVAGNIGTCTNVPVNTDPANECVGGECNGAGACEAVDGTACTLGTQCISGFCADGVCCNVACSGLCQACAAAKNGGVDGTCGNVTTGTDPDNECATDLASTCNKTGFCAGGACQQYAAGTTCVAQSCSAGVQQNADTCNGTGTCVDNGTTSCGLYQCNVAGTACRTVCSVDGDCASNAYCAGTTCTAKKADGAGCAGDNECTNGHCPAQDGVCCNTACSGTCQACAAAKTGGANGVCGNVTSGADPDNECALQAQSTCGTTGVCGTGACQLYTNGTVCLAQSCSMALKQNADICNGTGTCVDGGTAPCGAYECNVAGTDCLTTCSSDMDCNTGFYCSGTTCVAQKSGGTACGGANECLSGFCPSPDNVCCDAACNTTCKGCTLARTGLANGTCGNITAGTDPDTECPGNGGTDVCAGGACKLANGGACGVDGTLCASGHCVDGVCCDTACTGLCQACSAAKTGGANGVCGNVTNGTDPDNECAQAAKSTCGNDGTCDGAGACRKWALGTQCAGTCAGHTITNLQVCDGLGTCDTDTMASVDCGSGNNCGPFACGDATACTQDSDCPANTYCFGAVFSGTVSGNCLPKLGTGLPCTAPTQCASNTCTSGSCT